MQNYGQNSKLSLIFLFFFSGAKLYLEENDHFYYGVPVPNGKTMVEGTVADTCDAAGMRAVCEGPAGCKYNSIRCQVVPPESALGCGSAMSGLAKKICDGKKREDCQKMNGLFSYVTNWSGNGECGVVDGKSCVLGKDYVSGDSTYAYCVKYEK